MAMVVKNNMSAVSTLNTLNKNSSALQKSLAKVSSGMKINSAQDDASGYAISEKMRVQIRSLDQANQNTQNAASMMKTAEGAVSSTVEILKSLKEKAINAATDTNTDSDRVTIQKEIDQFIDQIDDNALTTFNGKYLVDGSKAQQGQATYTAMTNQSLATDTKSSSALTDLKNRNNESLEIASTDYVTVSYVQNGKTYTTKSDQIGNMTLQGIFQLAEDIDSDAAEPTQTFAAGDNPSVQTADSATFPADAAQNIEDKKKAWDDAKQAETDYLASQEYADLVQAEADAKAAYEAAGTDQTSNLQKAVDDAKDAIATRLGTGNKADGADGAIGAVATAAAAYNAAQANNSTKIGFGTMPAVLSTADLGTDIPTAGQTVLDALDDESTNNTAGFKADTVNGGKDAYDGLKKALDDYNDAKDELDNYTFDPTAVDTAKQTYEQAKEAREAAAKQYSDATAAAKKEYDEAAGPAILATKNVGVNTAKDMVETADGTVGLTITAAQSGITNQISGVTISITDSEGNVKKSANAALDQFRTTIYAKNKSDRNELTFQVGAAANQSITVGLDDMRAEALGLKSSDGTKVSVATQDNANAAVAVFDNAIQKALDQQTTIGAVEARLEYTGNNLTTSSENVQAAESTIRDADMAKEMTAYTKNNVLLQAAQSMLAQANQSSSQVLSLLQ